MFDILNSSCTDTVQCVQIGSTYLVIPVNSLP